MAYVITEPCASTMDAACVEVCPVDCIHPTEREPEGLLAPMRYIDPIGCIDCGACVPACPVGAIYFAPELPAAWRKYERINALWFQI